jgi:hypothetical protein
MAAIRRSLLVSILLLIPTLASATWEYGGVPVDGGPNGVARPVLASDGNGGVIVAWDRPASLGGDPDVYAQRLDQNGNLLWAAGGVTITATNTYELSVSILPDGAGGAFVCWKDSVNGGLTNRVWVSRVNADGQVLWSIMVAAGMENAFRNTRMISDGVSGVIFAWDNEATGDAYAQRIDANGQPKWGPTGMQICGAAENQFYARLALDGDGAVIITWNDQRDSYVVPGGPFYEKVIINHVFGQRLWLDGTKQWDVDGKSLRDNAANYDLWRGTPLVGQSDGATMIYSKNTLQNLYAQKFSSDGNVVWEDVHLFSATSLDARAARALPDGADGSVVLWSDARTGNLDLYAQRLDAAGNVLWADGGATLFGAAGDQALYEVIPDGTGGVVAYVGPPACCGTARLQRMDGNGQLPWGATGVPLSDSNFFYFDAGLVIDGSTVYCAWWDTRNGSFIVFVQRFNLSDGSWGGPVSVAISSFRAEADRGTVRLDASFRSDLGVERVNVYRGGAAGSIVGLAEGEPQGDRFQYVDSKVSAGETYRYQVGVVDADGEFLSPVQTVTVPRAVTALDQNHPNPFNPRTTIRFTLASTGHTELSIYDADGMLVRSLVNASRSAGPHSIEWDGRGDSGSPVSSGVYFYKLTAGKFSESRKMVLLK